MHNDMAKFLKAVSIFIFIIGGIAGIVIGKTEDGFYWSITLGVWVKVFLSGVLFMSFAELLNILDACRSYLWDISEKNDRTLKMVEDIESNMKETIEE